MRLTGEFSFEAAPQAVWTALMDPDVLRSALPGTDRIDRIDDTHFDASWRVRLGPIRGSFTGAIVLSGVQPLVSYHMSASGRGPIGVVTGEADFRLRAEGGATVLDYDLEVRVSGRLAAIGQRLVESSMRSLVRDALQGLAEQIRARVAGAGNGIGGGNDAGGGSGA